jgi:hypothetical protein
MTLVLILALIAASAIVITVFPSLWRSLQGRRLSAPRASGISARQGTSGRPLVGADAPMLLGAETSVGMAEDPLVVRRVDTPRPAGNGSGGERGGDHLSKERWGERMPRLVGQNPALSRRAERRQSLRSPDAGEVEDPSEMERQVRDQLYGPGFRRR